MLFDRRSLDGLADGTITLAFRRWAKPRVKVGTHLRTRIGVVEVTSLELVGDDDVSDADGVAAGFTDGAAAVARTGRSARAREPLYRIGLRLVGDDPRIALRDTVVSTDEERTTVAAALGRLDRAADTPWTETVLRLIGERPAVISTDLAAELGLPRDMFKRRVRRLKELGLTESLEVGYRLSPRGKAWLDTD